MTTMSSPLAHSIDDAGRRRAGQAVAERRQRLGLSQRDLNDDKTISQSVLVAFERGRSWPRQSTRSKLEVRLRWPLGTIDRIRTGLINDNDHSRVDSYNEAAHQITLTVEAAQIALDNITTRIGELPPPTGAGFIAAAAPLLEDLRKLRETSTRAAHHRATSIEAVLVLSDVRRTYHELMLLCAHAPGPTLGQRLYAFRHRTKLTVDETAYAAGVSADSVNAAEAEQPVSDTAVGALELVLQSHAAHC